MIVLAIWCLATTTAFAQDFRLLMSKSIMELPNYKKAAAINQITDWVEVTDGGIYSNFMEVNSMLETMRTPGMKGLEAAQQFRKMRDHTVLTFKFDDEMKYNTYNVVAKHGKVTKKLTTSGYFFMNLPMSNEHVELTVSAVHDPDHPIRFKCKSEPFGNDSIYLFQLDKVCQKVNDTFNLEVMMSDSTWENMPITNQKFQCLFSSRNRYPVQAFLGVTDKKLELDVDKWNPGVGLAGSFENLVLKKDCNFTTHNAEFATFNWIGAGLLADYDTLFLQVRNIKSQLIKNADIYIQRIDYEKQPVYDPDLRFIGIDEKTGDYMILTKGYPAYIEVLADGYLPLLYHYKGAADPVTHILSKTCISDYVVMTAGNANPNETTFFKKELRFLEKKEYYLNPKKKIWDANVLAIDLVKTPITETVYFSPNGSTDELKMADGEPREKYATLELHYAVPRGAHIAEAGILELDLKDSEEKAYAPHIGNEVIDANIYKGLAHSFVVSKYDLSECVPNGETAAITLRNGEMNDRDYPLIRNFSYTQDEIEDKAEDETEAPTDALDEEDPQEEMESALDLGIPVNITFQISDAVRVRMAVKLDFLKKEINWELILEAFTDSDDDGGAFDKAAERNETVNDYKKFVKNDAEGEKQRAYGFTSDVVDTDEDVNEIFDQTIESGQGLAFSLWASGKVPFTGWGEHAKTNFFDFLEELGGSLGYYTTYGLTSMGNLLRAKNMEAAATWADLIETFLRFGFKFDCYVGGEFGLTTLDDLHSDDLDGRALYVEALAYAILAAWLEVGLPSNPMLNFSVGIRGGGKLGISGKYVYAFNGQDAIGMKLTARALMQYYINVDTFLGGYHNSGNIFDVGGDKLIPDDDTNPYHDKFPNWLSPKKHTRANSYKPLHATIDIDNGRVVYENVAMDADPHYLDENSIVINHLHDSKVYDDDAIDIVDLQKGETTKLSSNEYLAIRHNMDVSGDKKIIVYQQCDTIVSPESVTDDNFDQRSMELSKHFDICADILQEDGTWKKYVVYQSEKANLKPIAAIQDDGKAAVIWQSGTFDKSIARTDSLLHQNMEGRLLYSRFDGQKWSEPIAITNIFENHVVGDYQAIMRNDTVLAAVQGIYPNSPTNEMTIKYFCIPEDPYMCHYVTESLKAYSFSLRKVGDHNIVALTHELDTCKYDVFVKTLKMSGIPSGLANSDVDLQDYSPIGARIIPAVNASGVADFALMWMENTDKGRTENGKEQKLNRPRRVLNAARMSYSGDILAATPITVGMEENDLMMLNYDGYLDDDRIKVVYTLTDPELRGGTVIVENEKYFTNSFDYDIRFNQRIVNSGVYVPLILTVNNTGTSAIKGITAHLNNQVIEVEDAFVPPFEERSFFISYMLEDNFNGYISSKVDVEFENIFKSSFNVKRRVSNLAASETKQIIVNTVDAELRLLAQHVDDEGNNSFVIEFVNNSKIKLRPDQDIFLAVLNDPRFDREENVMEMVTIPASQMKEYGTVEKITAAITVPAVNNEVAAVLLAMVIPHDGESDYYQDVNINDNYQYVKLYEKGTPTYINGVRADLRGERQMKGQRISFTYKPNGILVHGLNIGETLRLYDLGGREVFSAKAKDATMLVPIDRHAFFVLSTDDESIKFMF